MKIKSKKTGNVHEISAEEWEQMRGRNEHRLYQIIDGTDNYLGSEEIKVEPIELVEKEVDDEVAEEDFIKSYLDEIGVSYHPNLGIKKLRKLYEENL